MTDPEQQSKSRQNPPPVEHQWKPGQSGNPGGRKKGTGITDRLRKLVEKDDGKVANALVEAAIKAAKKGDFRFWQAIVDRVDGPVKQRLEAEIHQIIVKWEDREMVKDD